jgi:RNA polymerase sigma factor (sigma-70 family)
MPASDRIAFERLVADHHGRACAVAYAVLRDRARSEEIAQDALLLAWQRRDQIPAHAAAWLCAIARNLARNAARRPRMVSLDADVADHGDPLHSMLEAEELRRAGDALAELPDDEREAIVLFYRAGASVHAIAEAAGISDDAARKRLQRGRDRLRDQLGGVERRVARTRPAAAVAGACVVAWLARSTPAAAAAAAPAAVVAAGTVKVVALVVAATAVVAGAVMLVRAVEPPAEAATVVAPPAAPAQAAARHADAPTPTLPAARAAASPPPIDPQYADLSFELFDPPADYQWTAQNVLDFVSMRASLPIYVDRRVDLSVKIDSAAITGRTVGEAFDQLLAQLHATRTEVPGLRTTAFGPPPDGSCAAGFGGDRIDARYVDAPDLHDVTDMLAEHLRVPMFIAQRAWPITVELHGTAGEAFDQLVATSRMGCTVEPGYVIAPGG